MVEEEVMLVELLVEPEVTLVELVKVEVMEVMMVDGHHGGGDEVRAEEAVMVEAMQVEEMVMVEVTETEVMEGMMRYKRLWWGRKKWRWKSPGGSRRWWRGWRRRLCRHSTVVVPRDHCGGGGPTSGRAASGGRG